MSVSKFYIRYKEDLPEAENQAVALYGFRSRGTETAPFYGFGDIFNLNDLGLDVGLSGYIGDVWEALDKVGVPRPPSLDYPDDLQEFLGREIQKSDLKTARSLTHRKIFVKPVKQKLFTGFVTTGTFNDQIRLGCYNEDEEVWISDFIPFVSEYRCFILCSEILSVRWYKGDWSKSLQRDVVESAVQNYSSAPVAYTLDFGVTQGGETVLVEVNDGFAMGTYGLPGPLYASMLEARWEEMVGNK